MSYGFIDLRPRGEETRLSENFWPSFTDIMMVIVMIFLIASTVLILRNWELVAELRATMEAEREAAAVAHSATEASQALKQDLAQAEHQISLLRMQLMQQTEINQEQSQRLAEQSNTIGELSTRNSKLQSTLEQQQDEIADYRARLADTRQQVAALESEIDKREQTLAEARSELAARDKALAAQRERLQQLSQERDAFQQQLSTLEGDYEEIKKKYEKLIKPARTAKGKYVVETRFDKRAGSYRYAIREPGQQDYRILSRKKLYSELSALQKKYDQRLYIKVVIPENSGLSYNEAWSFTKDVLRYDYYYQ